MKKGATTEFEGASYSSSIIALRNEKGSYNNVPIKTTRALIIALRNEKGSYNLWTALATALLIIALRNEKGSYNNSVKVTCR